MDERVRSSGYVRYAAYEGVSERAGLIHAGCFAHSRRRFFEALKGLPNAQRKQASAAHEAVRRIEALYLIERQIKDLGDEERTRIRREEAVPQLRSLYEWASKMQHETMPSGKLGEALSSVHNYGRSGSHGRVEPLVFGAGDPKSGGVFQERREFCPLVHSAGVFCQGHSEVTD